MLWNTLGLSSLRDCLFHLNFESVVLSFFVTFILVSTAWALMSGLLELAGLYTRLVWPLLVTAMAECDKFRDNNLVVVGFAVFPEEWVSFSLSAVASIGLYTRLPWRNWLFFLQVLFKLECWLYREAPGNRWFATGFGAMEDFLWAWMIPEMWWIKYASF